MKKVSICLWCESNKLEEAAKRKDGIKVLKCLSCGLFMNAAIPENPADYYQEDYYQATEAEENKGYEGVYYLVSPAFLFWQNSFIEEVNETHDKKLFLEIGCATGSLLEILRENQPHLGLSGIDISDYAVKVTKDKGFEAQVAYIQEYKATPKKDIIFSSETMEHLDDLKSFLQGVINNLSKDGIFIFYVPSIVEEDARKESENYIRFRSNMEHLLHFTPDFFEKELPSLFDANVLIQEFRTGFGPCILGAISKNKASLSDVKKLFKALDSQKLPTALSKTLLKNLTVFALKFGRFELANKALKAIEKERDFNPKDKALIYGLASYHKGELEKADSFFQEYLRMSPGSQVAIKLLLSNAKELNHIYRSEIQKMQQQAVDAKTRVAELENSKIVGQAIRLRKIAGRARKLGRNIKPKG